MAKKSIVNITEEIFSNLQSDFELYELVDVQYVKEGANWYLRLFVDKEGGLTLDDCTKISRAVNQELDRIDPIDKAYILEVSSPGIERPLKKDADFIRFAGEKVEIKLYAAIDGKKKIEAELNGFDNGKVIITPLGQTEKIELSRDNIAQAKLLFTFD